MRASAILQYSLSCSIPINGLPVLLQAIQVVPEPANGSKTIPPVGVLVKIQRYSISLSGLTVL